MKRLIIKDLITAMLITSSVVATLPACGSENQCRDGEGPASGTSEVTILISGCEYAPVAKSAFRWQDDAINDVEVIITDEEGGLVDVLYSDSPSELSFRGKIGSKYLIWGAANIGGKISVNELKDFTSGTRTVSYQQIMDSGIPMYSREPAGGLPGPCSVTVGKEPETVILEMVRMMARISFTVDRSYLDHPEAFTVSSLKLYNAVDSYTPFADEVRQESGSSSGSYDYATQDDLDTVNDGGAVMLYAFENLQGNLLPDNEDPWAKVPSNIGDAGSRCSYLEMECSYSYSGMSCDNVTYRMYLGEDAVTNFDVRRNTRYSVTLFPTEEEIDGHRGSWKVESSGWNDSRSLRFNPRRLTVQAMGSTATTVIKNPSDLEYTLTAEGFKAAGLTWSRKGDKITISSTEDISSQKTATLHATTLDGRHSDECIITVTVRDVVTHEVIVTPSSQTLAEGGTACLKAIYYTITNGTRDSGKDVTDSAAWTIVSGSGYISMTTVKGQYSWVSGPGTAVVKASYSGCDGTATIITGEPDEYEITVKSQ